MSNKKLVIVIYFISLLFFGSVGFYFLGNENWSWIDSIYMTVITLSTVGFGEVYPLTETGKIWAILVILFGVTGIGVFVNVLREEFIQIEQFRERKIMKKISRLKNHFIICGYGRMGQVIASELNEKNLDFVVIENNETKAEIIRGKGFYCIQGDATMEETLQTAQLTKAAGVAIVLDTDQDNLFVTLSMKTMNPELFILSRCSKEDNISKLMRAGANKVVNPYTTGGQRMAEILSKPQIEDSFSVLSSKHLHLDLTLDEISLEKLSKYNGVPIKDSRLREDYDVMIVGIIDEKGDTIISPHPDTVLNSSHIILVMGKQENMNNFTHDLPS